MTLLASLALAAALLVVAPARAHALEIGPDDDLCAAIDSLPPGEELVLKPGDYKGGCPVRRGGQPGTPLVIRAADSDRPPRLIYPGRPVNMLELRASDVTIRGIDFWGAFGIADGVRIISGHRITIEGCRFFQLGGIAVAATHASVQGLTVRGNSIKESHATGMYFGCHDGIGCAISGLLVEGNYIDGVSATNPEIGYGIQVKLSSSGVIRDNVIHDTKGPGIMVYGSRDLVTVSVVERNFVRGSRTSSGIVVGGGPAMVRNNISGWNFEAGIGIENYGGRNLLRGIRVIHNTVYGNGRGGIVVPEQGYVEATISNNAIHARLGTTSLPPPRAGVRMVGNVDCTWAVCFTDPEGMDFSPFPGSLLVAPAQPRGNDGAPTDDYFRSARRTPPNIGAVERAMGPIHLGVKEGH